ncbi:hypothetical protein EGH90_04835 [Kaistella haifensis]|nr:hypothetical protein EGH90_04835 [Kaistella haifensis]
MKIEESVLDQIRSRPRFKIYTKISREKYVEILKEFLKNQSEHYTGNINSETATIMVKSDHSSYWKPCLSLRTEHDSEENKTLIRGIFGPTSAVWTFFMFLYFIGSILWMVFITMWFVEKQIKSNDFPWALTASFVTLFFLGCTYFATKIGQNQAREEMRKLRDFAEKSILQFEH